MKEKSLLDILAEEDLKFPNLDEQVLQRAASENASPGAIFALDYIAGSLSGEERKKFLQQDLGIHELLEQGSGIVGIPDKTLSKSCPDVSMFYQSMQYFDQVITALESGNLELLMDAKDNAFNSLGEVSDKGIRTAILKSFFNNAIFYECDSLASECIKVDDKQGFNALDYKYLLLHTHRLKTEAFPETISQVKGTITRQIEKGSRPVKLDISKFCESVEDDSWLKGFYSYTSFLHKLHKRIKDSNEFKKLHEVRGYVVASFFGLLSYRNQLHITRNSGYTIRRGLYCSCALEWGASALLLIGGFTYSLAGGDDSSMNIFGGVRLPIFLGLESTLRYFAYTEHFGVTGSLLIRPFEYVFDAGVLLSYGAKKGYDTLKCKLTNKQK